MKIKLYKNFYIRKKELKHLISKSIRETLIGKKGLIRRNLLGKRVNFSARSVITAETKLNIEECGIPEKICMIKR